ncbi:MFS transporter [Bifidobacterium adolescentis]|uniref:MFS transporter n=1 Tax=Bifidobacterium adolescentis TaxID=1680 RepID=UPI001E293C26|nr:MFS transporter [Bifidobacterium adolescentis]MDB0657511.1 MFS transporter [Bifidobacterium adolescentis]MDB0660291.1 MFS transporter [Bifidobacterium adolescentis]MDB0661981.1 MFS transporter [Bifidobacterium adolescentis]MDB1344913.1 MFS transporter [Bifidobacterium adolescentis]MDB1348165.1 MFS transporter [Bifidobacterium adolescentis]
MKTADKTRETPAFPKTFIMAMIFGVGLNPVNSTLISTALAPISHDLRIDAGRATLLISALYLTCAIAQPTAGKLSEIIGPRSVFMAGAALVMIGGLLGGFAPNLGVLLTSRVLIGAGTSCGYPAAMLLVRRRADRMGLAEPPSLVLSILAMVGLVLIAVGPPLGGLLVTFLGWRSTFFVNVLVGIITIVLGLASIEPDAKHEHRMTVSFFIAHLDVMGLLLFSITISALLIVLSEFAYFRQGVRLRHCHRFVGFCRVGVACGNAFRRCAFTRGG